MKKLEKIYILETIDVIKNYSYVESIRDMIGADFVYFKYSSKNSLREASEIEKTLINSLVDICNETGYSASGLQ